jgi:PAS domain S-box-containing protein
MRRATTDPVPGDRSPDEVAAYLAAIVESSDDAIIGKTLDGIITSWNAGATRIFGYTAEEMIGQPISLLVPADRPDDARQILERIRRGERVHHYETERLRKDGRRIYVSLSVSPIKDASGTIVGASKIARDVTERRDAEEERERLLADAQQARALAEAASRAKDDLLSVVSHELRTPLSAMLGWVAVLKKGKLPPARVSAAFETIERSGRMQEELISDLLDMSRIVTNRLRLELAPVDLRALAEATADGIRPAASAKDVTLRTSTAVEAIVVGDAVRLQQALSNVLDNAVKFTPAGGSVELRLERTDRDARIVVRDSGAGLAAGFLPHIFEPFRQAENVTSRKSGGLGLGLAIARDLVERHRGTITAENAGEGTGAIFTITLPLSE